MFALLQNDPKASHTCENLANEANPYLTFIAEYYDCLPNVRLLLACTAQYLHGSGRTLSTNCDMQVTLFIHAHRKSSTHSVYNVDYDVNTVRYACGCSIRHQCISDCCHKTN